MSDAPNSTAWAVATALAYESGLDWAAWARGETSYVGVCPCCSREYLARTHTHCPPCFEGTSFDTDIRLRTKCTPVPAPWDTDAYRADCARRGVEPGPLPSLSWTGEDGFGWEVSEHGDIDFMWCGEAIAGWGSRLDMIEFYTDDDGRARVEYPREVVARIVTLATAAKRAMGL